jgi:hypothetical protein
VSKKGKKSWLRRHRWHVVSATLAGCVVALSILGYVAHQQAGLLTAIARYLVGEFK